jgi:hypothetical protein
MKLKKSTQIVVGVLVGLVIIAMVSSPDDTNETTKQETGQLTAATTSDDKATESSPALFASAAEFKTAFNLAAGSNSFDYEINKIDVQEGEVNNTFQHTINNNISLLGSVNKANGSVKEITMIGKGDGTAKSGADILGMMAVIIGTVDPELPANGRGEILKQLRLFGDNAADLKDHTATTDKNGIHYFINSSEVMGIWFGAKRN